MVLCDDRAGMLKEFTAIISDEGTNIRSVDSKVAADGSAVVDFVIEIVDLRQLNKLVQGLRRVPGVRDVQRVQKILARGARASSGQWTADLRSCCQSCHLERCPSSALAGLRV